MIVCCLLSLLIVDRSSMSVAEFGNVLYFGVLASFCGGWVPLRSLKNLKLTVFHLYTFLSFLLLPFVIISVSDSTVTIAVDPRVNHLVGIIQN